MPEAINSSDRNHIQVASNWEPIQTANEHNAIEQQQQYQSNSRNGQIHQFQDGKA